MSGDVGASACALRGEFVEVSKELVMSLLRRLMNVQGCVFGSAGSWKIGQLMAPGACLGPAGGGMAADRLRILAFKDIFSARVLLDLRTVKRKLRAVSASKCTFSVTTSPC
jgi:hypothetical protein